MTPPRLPCLSKATDAIPDMKKVVGLDAPSEVDLQLHVDRTGWTFHVKALSPVNLRSLLNLAELHCTATQRDTVLRALAVLQDAALYPSTLTPSPPSRLPRACLDQLIANNHAEPLTPEFLRAHNISFPTVVLFLVPEAWKARFRVIKHTRCTNAHQQSTDFPVRLPTPREVEGTMKNAQWFGSLDFSGWFDQLELHDDLIPWNVFAVGSRLFRLKRLAMGQTTSVFAAQTIASLIAHVAAVRAELTSSTSFQHLVYIDNIFPVSSQGRENVARFCQHFLLTCRDVGAAVNEIDLNTANLCDEASFAHFIVQEGEVLGKHFNTGNHTVKLGAKSTGKAQNLLELIRSIPGTQFLTTKRRFAAICALGLYGLGVSKHSARSFSHLFTALNRIYTSAASFASSEALLKRFWSSEFLVDEELKDQMEHILKLMQINEPRAIDPRLSREKLLFVDASSHAWGAALLANGTMKVASGKWFDEVRHLTKHSAFAEPRAVVEAVYRLVPSNYEGEIMVVTDHLPMVSAFNEPWRPSSWQRAYGGALELLANFAPRASFRAVHLPGKHMPVDQLSRGGEAPSLAQVEEATRYIF